MCSNNSKDNLYDIVFGQDNAQPGSDGDNTLFSIFNDDAGTASATFSRNDTSVSSLEEKYSNRVNIRIDNID
jgi:hypothetical protein